MLRHFLAGLLCVTLGLGGVPPALAAGDTKNERLEDLDFLIETLDENHPDFYSNTSKQQVQEKKQDIADHADDMSGLDFAIALSELAAMGGDSHTSISVGSELAQSMKFIPIAAGWFDGRVTITALPIEYSENVGMELAGINGHTLSDIMSSVSQMISYDNEVRLRRSFLSVVYSADVLAHYGFSEPDAQSAALNLRDGEGKEITLDLPVVNFDKFQEMTQGGLATINTLRKAVPPTEPADAYYKMFDLDENTVYIQYNRCMEAPDLPMSEFAEAVKNALNSRNRLIIDLRNNSGGSDGVLNPVVYQAQQLIARGGEAYVLAGENTFSSALINTVQLKDVGAVFVGEPTGGSVDHFGQVTGFELPNSKTRGQYSNKFIDLGALYQAAQPYGVESFKPDIEASQSFEDYINGVDSVVQYILTHGPATFETTAEAHASSARVSVDGVQAGVSAYNINGNNYFRLRDLAAAFKSTDFAFNVEWDPQNHAFTIALGEYMPSAEDVPPLAQEVSVASRAKADMYAKQEDGSLIPLVCRAYLINGNHYIKLRDICAVMGVSVSWDSTSRLINVDTQKPYFDFSSPSKK